MKSVPQKSKRGLSKSAPETAFSIPELPGDTMPTMTRGEALKLLRPTLGGIKEWNERREAGDEIPIFGAINCE